MNKEELLKAIMKLPKEKPNIPITTMNSINVDDLISAVDRLNKVPTYDELLKENKRQREVINKAIEYINEYVFLDDNGCGDYWWEIADKDKLLDILKEVER